MTATILAAAMLAATLGSERIDLRYGRDADLITPAPYPPGRVDDVRRPQNGRLWVSRHPIGSRRPIAEQIGGEPGPASYGAPWASVNDLIYVDVNHVPIAISPWTRFPEEGFQQFERARNQWLKEQGYVLGVRTHVNSRYLHAPSRMYAGDIQPRATIRLEDEPMRRKSKLRVLGPEVNEATVLAHAPVTRPYSGPIVVLPKQTPSTTTAAAE